MVNLDLKRIEQILKNAWPGTPFERLKHRHDGRTCMVDEATGIIRCIGCAHTWYINTTNDMGPEEIKFHFGMYDPDVYKIVDDKKAGCYKLEFVRSGGETQAPISEVFGDD